MKIINKILVIVCIILFALFLNECSNSNRLSQNNKSLIQDTIRIRNEKGQEIVKLKTVYERSTKDLMKFYEDSLTGLMKVNRKTNLVAEIKIKSKANYSSPTIIIDSIRDTLYTEYPCVKPIYTSYFADPYFSAYVTSGPDSSHMTRESFVDLVIKTDQKRGVFKTYPLEFSVLNKDPNATITNVDVNSVKPKKTVLEKIDFYVGFLLPILINKTIKK